MLTGQNGILTNASNANVANVYYGAEEQVKLAYMAVKAQIIAETVADANYDATTEENTTKLGKIVEDDLKGAGWKVNYSMAGNIFITYNNSSIMADTIEEGKPSKNGKVDFTVLLEKQEATLKTGGLLPAEYQQVEYIESTGTQYIDSGVVPSVSTGISVLISDFEKKPWTVILGCVTAYRTETRYRISMENNNLYVFFGNKVKIEIPNFSSITIDFNKPTGILKYNKQEYNISNTSFTSSNNSITIFAENNSEGIQSFGSFKLNKFEIYENNEIMRSFIPCKTTTSVTNVDGIQCPSGTVGLYDTVEEKFYTNQGTGEFIAGADV